MIARTARPHLPDRAGPAMSRGPGARTCQPPALTVTRDVHPGTTRHGPGVQIAACARLPHAITMLRVQAPGGAAVSPDPRLVDLASIPAFLTRWTKHAVTGVIDVQALSVPLSRCLFVLEQVRDRAQALDMPVIVRLAEYAIGRLKEALDLDQRQRALRTSRFPPEARELDLLVDAAIDGLDSYCESQMSLYRGEERAVAAARLRRALLPGGVGEITQLPYADQHKQIDALLARAQAPDVVADLAVLPEMVTALARVRELNAQYGERLRDTQEALTRQDVRARHEEC
jgi:hypothetical protein